MLIHADSYFIDYRHGRFAQKTDFTEKKILKGPHGKNESWNQNRLYWKKKKISDLICFEHINAKKKNMWIETNSPMLHFIVK